MRARLYCPPPLRSGVEIELPQHAAHHAARVLRLRSGDTITLFTGEGGEFDAELTKVGARAVLARVGDARAVERESPLAVTLVQGLASAERMDWIVQKAVELGIAAIAPVATARSVARADADCDDANPCTDDSCQNSKDWLEVPSAFLRHGG